jgi:hypothetical protein
MAHAIERRDQIRELNHSDTCCIHCIRLHPLHLRLLHPLHQAIHCRRVCGLPGSIRNVACNPARNKKVEEERVGAQGERERGRGKEGQGAEGQR